MLVIDVDIPARDGQTVTIKLVLNDDQRCSNVQTYRYDKQIHRK